MQMNGPQYCFSGRDNFVSGSLGTMWPNSFRLWVSLKGQTKAKGTAPNMIYAIAIFNWQLMLSTCHWLYDYHLALISANGKGRP